MEFQTYNILEPEFFKDSGVNRSNSVAVFVIAILFVAGISYLIYENLNRENKNSNTTG